MRRGRRRLTGGGRGGAAVEHFRIVDSGGPCCEKNGRRIVKGKAVEAQGETVKGTEKSQEKAVKN